MFMLVLLVEHIFLTNFYGLYLFSLKSSRPCRGLNPGPPRHQADMLPTELSWLGWKREREIEREREREREKVFVFLKPRGENV